MKRERTTIRRGFECRNCGNRVNPAAYRAACPNCGGQLRDVPVVS